MPTIPRYDEQRVDLNPLPGQRQQISAPADAFGAEQAKQISQVGNIVSDVGAGLLKEHLRQLDVAHTATANDALTRANDDFQKKQRDIMNKAGDYVGPNAKFQTGLASALEDASQAAYQGAGATLSGPAADKYQAAADARHALNRTEAAKAEHAATNKFIVDAATNVVASEQNALAALPTKNLEDVVTLGDGTTTNPVDIHIGAIKRAVDGVPGLNDAARAEMIRKVTGKTVYDLISRANDDGYPSTAGALRDRYKDLLDADQNEKLVKNTEEKQFEVAGNAYAQGAFATKETLPDLLARVNKEQPNDAMREKISKVVKQKFEERAQVVRFDQAAARQELFKYQETHPGAFPSRITDRMDAEVVASLREAHNKKAAGVEIKTDPKLYGAILQRLNANDGSIANEDLTKYANRIAPSQLNQLMEKQAALFKPEAADKETVSESEQLKAAQNSLALKDEELGAFQTAYNDIVATLPKKPSYDERAKIIQKITLQTLSGRKHLYNFPKDKWATVELAIPEDEYNALAAEAKAKGNDDPSDSLIQSMYRTKKGIL